MKSMEFKALTAQYMETKKFIMTLQTQGYAPKDIWGLE
jgi:hypothetical protein